MIKRLISTLMLGAAVFSAAAVESRLTYSYAGDDFDPWGKSKSEIYDVAIRISDPALVGKRITSIRADINAYEGIESTSVWLSKELTLEKVGSVKVTVPDTYVAEVAPEKIELPGADVCYGRLSAVPATPCIIPEGGIYVGYSLSVPAVQSGETLTDMQKKPILLSPSANPESLYLRTSKDILKWMAYNDKLDAAATIYVTIEGDFPEYSVGIKDIPVAYAKVNEEFTVEASLSNCGAEPVSKIGYTYSIAGKDFENTIDLDAPIKPDFVNTSVVRLPIAALDDFGQFTLDLKITEVNGGVNGNVAAEASAQVNVLPFLPVHRPMLEEFTGTWCGWCTRGYWALETLNELYGDAVVLAAYHDGDPMQAGGFPLNPQGYPSSTLNRNGTEDPYFGTGNSGFGMKGEVVASMETLVPAAIDVEASWVDAAKTGISVKATATFLENKTDAGYKIGYLLINNGLSNEMWRQSNYYSRYAGQMKGDDLEVLTTWPASVSGLVFNDVVVDVTGMMGVPGSLPSDVEFNTPYDDEFSFDIVGNDVIQDKGKLYVAAFIINPDGTILNAIKTKVVDSSAVGAVEAEVISTEYYTVSGTPVSSPEKGIYLKVSHYSDGSIRTAKVTSINH